MNRLTIKLTKVILGSDCGLFARFTGASLVLRDHSVGVLLLLLKSSHLESQLQGVSGQDHPACAVPVLPLDDVSGDGASPIGAGRGPGEGQRGRGDVRGLGGTGCSGDIYR